MSDVASLFRVGTESPLFTPLPDPVGGYEVRCVSTKQIFYESPVPLRDLFWTRAPRKTKKRLRLTRLTRLSP